MRTERSVQQRASDIAPGHGKRLPAYGCDLARRRVAHEFIPMALVCTDFGFWKAYRDRIVVPELDPVEQFDFHLLIDLHVLLCAGHRTPQSKIDALMDAILDAEPKSLTLWLPEWADNVVPIGRLAGHHLVSLPALMPDAAQVYRDLLQVYGTSNT